MNSTERKCLSWLARSRGIEEEEIIFSPTRTPDFTLPDGSTYEVKFLYKDKLIFFPSQIAALRRLPDTQVVVFRKNEDKPSFIIPAWGIIDTISQNKDMWRNIRLIVYGSNYIRLTLPKAITPDLTRYASDLGASVPSIVKAATVNYLREMGYVSSEKASGVLSSISILKAGEKLKCGKCEHEWCPKSTKPPKACPNCGSYGWREGWKQ